LEHKKTKEKTAPAQCAYDLNYIKGKGTHPAINTHRKRVTQT
jgi:hypothetical protein